MNGSAGLKVVSLYAAGSRSGHLLEGVEQQFEDDAVEHGRHEHADGEGDERPHDALAQLVEVLEQGEALVDVDGHRGSGLVAAGGAVGRARRPRVVDRRFGRRRSSAARAAAGVLQAPRLGTVSLPADATGTGLSTGGAAAAVAVAALRSTLIADLMSPRPVSTLTDDLRSLDALR